MSYRCVCGEIVPLDSADGGSCASCGRPYSGDVLHNAFAETVQLGDVNVASTARSDSGGDDALIGKTLSHYEIISMRSDDTQN